MPKRKPQPSAFRNVCTCCGQKAITALCLGCEYEANADCPNCRAVLQAKRDARQGQAAVDLYTPSNLRDALWHALREVEGAER